MKNTQTKKLTRSQLEALEQSNPGAFMHEVEQFAAGDYVLTKDNCEDIVAAMLDAADEREIQFIKAPARNVVKDEYFDRNVTTINGIVQI